MKKVKTYKIRYICVNCENTIVTKIPYGTAVRKAQVICPKCGIKQIITE